MKQILIITFIFLFVISSIDGQYADVVTGLKVPWQMALNGNDLFITESTGGRVSKIDLTNPEPTAQVVLSGLFDPSGLALYGNDLYIAEFGSGKILKVDITSSSPVAIEVVTGLSGPSCLLLKENVLFVSEYINGKISKIDLSASAPVSEVVLTDLEGPEGILFSGNDLLIAEADGDKILSVNISEDIPVVRNLINFIGTPIGLAKKGDEIFIGGSDQGAIFSFNLNDPFPVLKRITIFPLELPTWMIFNGNDMYISELDRITKFKLNTSDVSSFHVSDHYLYPNPSQNFIHVEGIHIRQNFKIFNSLGHLVIEGKISPNERLDIQNLQSGFYCLKFDIGPCISFIKE